MPTAREINTAVFSDWLLGRLVAMKGPLTREQAIDLAVRLELRAPGDLRNYLSIWPLHDPRGCRMCAPVVRRIEERFARIREVQAATMRRLGWTDETVTERATAR